MYIVGNEITIRWSLPPTDSPLPKSSYDIRFVPSSLEGTYADDGLSGYIAPTSTTPGCIEYIFTPLVHGLYRVHLCTGVATAFDVIDEKTMWVFLESPTSDISTRVVGSTSFPNG